MNYPHSEKYDAPELMAKIMGPNPLKPADELLMNCRIPAGATICDLGSGQGLTSVFLAKEYGFKVYASDFWSTPEEHIAFFRSMGLSDEQIQPVKTDATQGLPFAPNSLDGLVSIDSYHYFGRDEALLDEKILPALKPGAYL